jgi:hypothetical protein
MAEFGSIFKTDQKPVEPVGFGSIFEDEPIGLTESQQKTLRFMRGEEERGLVGEFFIGGGRGLMSILKTAGQAVDILKQSPLAEPVGDALEFLRDITGASSRTPEEQAELDAIMAENREIMEGQIAGIKSFLTPQADKRSKQIVGQIGEQVGRLATGVATGAPLVTLASQSGIQKMEQALSEGQDFKTSLKAGAAQWIIEYVTEKGPLGELRKIFKGTGGASILRGMAKEVGGELLAYGLETGLVDPRFLDKEIPDVDQIWREVQDITMVSLGTMAVAGGAGKTLDSTNTALNKLINKKTKEVEVTAEREEILKKVTPVMFTLDEKTPLETEIDVKEVDAEIDEKKEFIPPETPLEEETKPDSTIDDVEPVIPDRVTPDKQIFTEEHIEQEAEKPVVEVKKEPTDIVDNMMIESKSKIHELKGLTPKSIKDTATRWWLDVNHKPLAFLLKQSKETAERALRYFELIAHSDYKSNFEIEALRDTVLKGLNQNEIEDIDKFGFNVRHLEILKNNPDFIMPKVKDPKTGKQRRLTAQDLIESNANIPNLEKIFPRYEKLLNVFDSGLLELRDAGITTGEEIARLKKSGEFYQPRKVIEFISGPLQEVRFKDKTRSVHGNGMAALDKGSERLIDTDLFFLTQNYIISKNKRIFTNEANKALNEFIQENKADPNVTEVMREANIIKVTKEGKPVFEKKPAGWQAISFMEEGNQKKIFMRDDLAEGWIAVPPILSHAQSQFLQWISGAKILGFFATGGNPDFAARNPFRDMGLIWWVLGGKKIAGKKPLYSSSAPKFLAQMQGDMRTVAKDVISGTGIYKDMVMNGGGFGGMTSIGRVTDVNLRTIKEPLSQMEYIAGWLNNQSENITRTAIYHRALKNGFAKKDAAWIANSYLDFSKHGSLGQLVGNVRKYLNPSIQGTKNFVKEFKVNPKSALWKVSQIALLQTGIRYLWKYMDDDEEQSDDYNAIRPSDRNNNWCFPPMFKYTDSDGNRIGVFFKIPKDQSQRFMTSFIDQTINLYDPNEEIDYAELKRSLKDALPIDPTAVGIPLMDAIYGTKANFNWYAEKKISPENIDPKEAFTPYTHEFFVDVGQMTGWNPQKIEYFLKQYFTSNNFWASLAGKGYKTAKRSLGIEERNRMEQNAVRQIRSAPILKNFIGFTHPRNKLRREVEKIKNKDRTVNFAIDREIKIFMHNTRFLEREIDNKEQQGVDAREERLSLADNRKEFAEYLGTIPPHKEETALNRINKYASIEKLVHPGHWFALNQVRDPIERALLYHHYLVNETPRMAQQLEKDREFLMSKKNKGNAFGTRNKKFNATLKAIKAGFVKELQ